MRFPGDKKAAAQSVPLLPVPGERPCHSCSGAQHIALSEVGRLGPATVLNPGVLGTSRSCSHGDPAAGSLTGSQSLAPAGQALVLVSVRCCHVRHLFF